MRAPITIHDLKQTACAHLNQWLFEEAPKKKKRSKYNSNKKEVDGILFDSEREAARYGELKLMRKAGLISFLELQKVYELNPGGTHSYKYRADFVYIDTVTGETIVEDTKGFETLVFKKKEKLMKKVHGIIIKKT